RPGTDGQRASAGAAGQRGGGGGGAGRGSAAGFAHQRGGQLPARPAGLLAGGAALRPDLAAADADPAGGAGPQADRAALLPQYDPGENGSGTGHDPGAGLPPG